MSADLVCSTPSAVRAPARAALAVALAALTLTGCAPSLERLAPLIGPYSELIATAQQAGTVATPPAAPPAITIEPGGALALTVNGVPVDARSGPGLPTATAISRDLARTLYGAGADALDGGGLFDPRRRSSRIGPVVIAGRAEQALVDFGYGPALRWVGWHTADTLPGAMLLGPHALPHARVTYRLRDEQAGEVSVTLPLDPQDRWWLATTSVRIGDRDVRLAFAPQFPLSVASAATGALLARHHGGVFSGPARATLISHGVERPARPMRLATPLAVGGFSMRALLVRTADYGNIDGIPDAAANASDDDPSESAGDLVVTARRRGSAPLFVAYIGMDQLGGCSSITYDKPAATITLRCATPAP